MCQYLFEGTGFFYISLFFQKPFSWRILYSKIVFPLHKKEGVVACSCEKTRRLGMGPSSHISVTRNVCKRGSIGPPRQLHDFVGEKSAG